MSEETNGAEILSNEAPSPAEPQAAESVAQPAASNEPSWIDGIDEDYRGSIEARGLSDTNTLAKSYVNLVKLHGSNPNVVALPGEDATDEQKSAFYSSLGRPDEPSGYEIEIPADMPIDTEFLEGFKSEAHRLGLTAEQAAGVAKYHNDALMNDVGSQSQNALVQADQDIAALRSEWGGGYDAKLAEGRAAVNMLGMDDQTLNQLEMAMGTGQMLRFFQNIGSKIGEDKMIGAGDESFKGGMTPEQAQNEIAALSDDFKASLLNPRHAQHKANMDRWKSLNMYKGGR